MVGPLGVIGFFATFAGSFTLVLYKTLASSTQTSVFPKTKFAEVVLIFLQDKLVMSITYTSTLLDKTLKKAILFSAGFHVGLNADKLVGSPLMTKFLSAPTCLTEN